MSAPQSRGAREVLREIVRSGAGSVALHPLRSIVTVACVVAIVLPFLVGVGISHGLRGELTQAVDAGPDLYVTGTRFGRPVPLPSSAAEVLRAVPGVTAVVPRVVGEARLGARREPAVVVGLPADAVADAITSLDGRLFAADARDELVVGSELAARLRLRVGDVLPPFYRNERGERVSTVVGIFRSDAPLWQSHVVLVSLETSWTVFAERDTATSFLVRCPETIRGPAAARIRAIASLDGEGVPPVRPRVVTRDDVEALLLRRVLDRETLFQLPFVLAFAVGIPLVLVTSGAGLVERRREAGLLRAVGWSADALVFRALVESLLLAVMGAAIAVLLAFVWLRVANGAGIAPVLLPGADRMPGFRVPWRLGPVPVLLAFVVSGVLVAAGTLHSTWRAATAPPAEAMR